MKNSEVPDSNKRVQIGYQVVIEIIYRSGNRERLEFDLVHDHQADFQNGFIGVSTPLGRTILNEKKGYLIPYFTEEISAIQINSIEKSTRDPNLTTSTQEKESLEDIKAQIEFRNALLFASSADTKWGAYDPDGLEFQAWKAESHASDIPDKPVSKSKESS